MKTLFLSLVVLVAACSDDGSSRDAMAPSDTRPEDAMVADPDAAPALQEDSSAPTDTTPMVQNAGALPDTMAQDKPDALAVASDTSISDRDGDAVPSDAVTSGECNVVPIANVYGCQTADRLTAPFMGVERERITLYLDGNPVPPSLWRLADDGHTVVVQHCAGTMVLSFSLDCVVR